MGDPAALQQIPNEFSSNVMPTGRVVIFDKIREMRV
jgi:hypothetical protein